MTELGPEERVLLEKMGEEDGPTAIDEERVFRKLHRRLGVAALSGTAAMASTYTASAASTFVTKVALTVCLLAGGAATTVWVLRAHPGVTAPPQRSAIEAATAPTPTPAASAAAAPSSSWQPMPNVAPPRKRVEDTLNDEVSLMQRAEVALRAKRYPEALAALDQHEARFKRGALREERIALRASTLCRMGRTEEGRRQADQFLVEFPQSLSVEAVKSACER